MQLNTGPFSSVVERRSRKLLVLLSGGHRINPCRGHHAFAFCRAQRRPVARRVTTAGGTVQWTRLLFFLTFLRVPESKSGCDIVK